MKIMRFGKNFVEEPVNVATRTSFVMDNSPDIKPTLIGSGMAVLGAIGLAIALLWKRK